MIRCVSLKNARKVSTYLGLTLILFWPFLPYSFAAVDECASPNPNWVFCSGFEEGNFNKWTSYDASSQIIPDTGPFGISGNHILKWPFSLNQTGTVDILKMLDTPADRLYARWYVKYNGFDFTVGPHGGGFHGGDRSHLGISGNRPNGNDWFESRMQYNNVTGDTEYYSYTYYRGMYQDCSNPVGSCWGDSLPCDYGEPYCGGKYARQGPKINIANDTWYCVETMIDTGTPSTDGSVRDGQFTLWINDQLIGAYTDLWWRTVSSLHITALWMNVYFADPHPVCNLYYDNFVISTQRIGCQAGGGSNKPAPPQNLRITQ